MKLKERERSNLFYYLIKIKNSFLNFFLSKKVRMFILVLLIIIIFISGSLFGLLISGFFGTLDEPSELVLDIIHSFGIYGLGTFKAKLDEIRHENIRIPFNYIKGRFSNPEKIYIDIGFEDFQKIEYKREQAVGSLGFDGLIEPGMGILITSEEDYVPAKIRYNGEEVEVNIRLKGDITDHLTGDKWSFAGSPMSPALNEPVHSPALISE